MQKIVSEKTCKYPCSFTYIVVEASTVCMENRQKNVLQAGLCVIILKTVLVNTKGCEMEDHHEGGSGLASSSDCCDG